MEQRGIIASPPVADEKQAPAMWLLDHAWRDLTMDQRRSDWENGASIFPNGEPFGARQDQYGGSGYRRLPGNMHIGYIDLPATPLFAFGHGLSYTSFTYSNLMLHSHQVAIESQIHISARITNTGLADGDEVVQLYISDTATGVTRPAQELVGFQRFHLKQGESATVTFTIAMSQLGYLTIDDRFENESGPIQVLIGSASDDIRLKDTFLLLRFVSRSDPSVSEGATGGIYGGGVR